MNEINENLETPSEKCPCGKVGRFWMHKRVGHIKLCLDCMQWWLTEKLKMLVKENKTLKVDQT